MAKEGNYINRSITEREKGLGEGAAGTGCKRLDNIPCIKESKVMKKQ